MSELYKLMYPQGTAPELRDEPDYNKPPPWMPEPRLVNLEHKFAVWYLKEIPVGTPRAACSMDRESAEHYMMKVISRSHTLIQQIKQDRAHQNLMAGVYFKDLYDRAPGTTP